MQTEQNKGLNKVVDIHKHMEANQKKVVTMEDIAKKYQEFASEYVILRDGRRITQFEAALEEAQEAAEIANTRVTKRLVTTILKKNMEPEDEQ